MTELYSAQCTGGGVAGASFAAALQFLAASQCMLRESWPPQAKLRNKWSFDFIVVGGGAAGSVVASRLSEISEATVLLVEAGGDPPYESMIPGFKKAMKGTKYDWNFTTVNDDVSSQALQGGCQRYTAGKMLGGSGSLNDMVYARGNPADYDEWATFVGEDWCWDNVLPYFKKTEHLTDERIIDDPELQELHGYCGELEVSGFNESIYSTDKFLEAFTELGIEMVHDMASPVGAGRISHMIRDGKRDSTLTALLNKASTRSNLFVLKNAMVSKIIIDKNIARGITVIANGIEHHYFAKKEVVVTAGTINTAKLLLLSGIGPRDHLEELGVKVVADLPVGDNLQDHPKVFTYLAAESGTCMSSQEELYLDTVNYLYDRSGYLSQSTDLGAYISLNPDTKNIPDIAIFPTCIPVNDGIYKTCMNSLGFKKEICEKLEAENKHRELLSLAIELFKPKSRGKVRLASKDPSVDPLIHSGTFSDLDDLDVFPKSMDIAWSIANTTYFKTKNAYVVDFNFEGCEGLVDVELQKCWALSIVTSSKHLVGTAAMGMVVDSKLRVIGVKKLRVGDASAMMKVIRGNTYAPVVMIAEKVADYIKQEWFKDYC